MGSPLRSSQPHLPSLSNGLVLRRPYSRIQSYVLDNPTLRVPIIPTLHLHSIRVFSIYRTYRYLVCQYARQEYTPGGTRDKQLHRSSGGGHSRNGKPNCTLIRVLPVSCCQDARGMLTYVVRKIYYAICRRKIPEWPWFVQESRQLLPSGARWTPALLDTVFYTIAMVIHLLPYVYTNISIS